LVDGRVVNWEDEPLDVSLPLAALGVTGARFDAYDGGATPPSPI